MPQAQTPTERRAIDPDPDNQVPELLDYNLFDSDPVLRRWMAQHGTTPWQDLLRAQGQALGREASIRAGELANRHPPELQAFDRDGRRVNQVEFHPAWHEILSLYRGHGLASLPFDSEEPGRWSAFGAAFQMHTQIEAGALCPVTMTFASIPVLRNEPALFETLGEGLSSREHDPRDLPIERKRSIMIGMGMTEKQGGSDVRSNTTRAEPIDGRGRGAAHRLNGHKWFFSAPMCDAHLVLARNDDGLSCFFVPRWRPDGGRNGVDLLRLKDKLGNRSNSSGEVEFRDAWGVMIGEEGRGIPTIIEMATYTRLHCALGSAGLMRAALVQALHHARHRQAFGRRLVDQPLMRSVLADLTLESESASLLSLRLCEAFERAREDPLELAWKRILTPAAKFWICKRAVEFVGEAMEVLGGNGYVETLPMARLFREMPVNSIWEGSGNVMCLDVLRAISRHPESFGLLLEDLARDGADEPRLRTLVQRLGAMVQEAPQQLEAQARRFTEMLVLATQASLMLRHAGQRNAGAFIASRLGDDRGRVYGAIEPDPDIGGIVRDAWLD